MIDHERIEAAKAMQTGTPEEWLEAHDVLLAALAATEAENKILRQAVTRMWLHGERLTRGEYLRLTKTIDPLASGRPGEEPASERERSSVYGRLPGVPDPAIEPGNFVP